MNKRKLFYWCLYDFANSIIFINFLLYFSQWMVIDGGLSDLWYNALFAITSIMLFFSAPTLAAFTDKFGGRKYFLNFATIGTFLCYGLATVFAFLGIQYIFIVAFLFLMGQYFYQLAFIFYNSLIDNVSDTEHRARASGFGQFSNSLGQVSGLLLAIPLSATRLEPLFPSLLIFILLALPMMIAFKDSRPKERRADLPTLRAGQKEYFRKMAVFWAASAAIPMLVSFFFYNDALVTITNNYPIAMERVWGVPDTTKNMLLMLILGMSALGGIASGWVADKVGTLKTLKFILVGWIILVPLMAVSQNLLTLAIFTGMAGTLIGSAWAVSRAYLSELLTKEELSYGFSFYTLAERFATLFGPLAWGGIIAILGPESMSYRIAMLSMTVFMIIGYFILIRWRRKGTIVVSA